jgi:hypothetical protein
MFSPRQRPLLLVAERLLGVRLSLNTPVVGTAELPAGPARAAIVVHTEGGRRRFLVGVRSLRSGASVLYELEGDDLTETSGWAVALDAALSFGESMGFLFDDELLAERSPAALRRALASVREIIEPPGPAEQELADSEASPEEPEEPEILLDDAVEAEARPAAAAAKPAASSAQGGSRASDAATGERERAGTPLSKFRAAPGETAKPAPKAAPKPPVARLGRVRPVRVRSGDTQPPVGALLRLLAAF